MRKDVKVGLASGGVLLAVVVVYASSLNKPSTTAKSPLTLTGATKDAAATKRPVGSVQIASDNEPGRAVVPGPTETTVAAAPSEPDWSKLLETGAPPALMTRTPAPGAKPNESTHSAVDLFADTTGAIKPVVETAAPTTVADTTAAADPAGTPASDQATAPTLAATTFNGAAARPANTTPTGTPAAAASNGTSMRTYVVKEGESFYTIARDLYGNSHFYPHILRANPGVDPGKIRPGMTINVPDPAAVKPTAAPVVNPTGTAASAVRPSATAQLAGNEYRVGNNDNLYRIAVKLYGSPTKMQELYEFNKATIGEDPAKLKVGTVLKLPAPPTKKAE